MAVSFHKLLYLLFAVPSLVLANGDDQTIKNIAKQRLEQAIAFSEQTQQICKDQQTILPKGLLDKIELSADDKRTALSYFSLKNQNQCEEAARQTLLRATLFAREVKLADYAADEDVKALKVLLALDMLPLEMRYEARYLQLPAEAQAALAQLEPLKQGFKLLESAKNLGLYE